MAMIDPHWLQGLPGYQQYRASVGLPPIDPKEAGIGGLFGNIGNIGVKAFAGAAGIPVSGTKTGGNTAMPYTTTVPPPDNTGTFDLGSFLKNIGLSWPQPNTNPGNAPNATNGGGMPSWLLPLLAATAGGLENRSQTATSSLQQTPTYNPLEANFRDNLINKYTDFMNQDPNLAGFESNQLAANNKAYGLQAQNLQGDLAARGISGPAAQLAQSNLSNQNFAQNTQFRNTIPLLSRDLQGQALNSASGFFNSIPYGNKIESTQKQSGNVLGGITGGLAEALALMYGINARKA